MGILLKSERIRSKRFRLIPSSRCGSWNAYAKPTLLLNDHCKICEFQEKCHSRAVEADHLSLLRGITDREIKRYARKGIFTVTQLSHTFRARRKGKRSEPKSPKRQVALQAMAIRDRTIYVLGNPEVPKSPAQIFFDVEADPEEGYVYLIGMLCREGAVEKRHSFWADDKSQEADIFQQFLSVLA
jgi:predicted RecB family nuclease